MKERLAELRDELESEKIAGIAEVQERLTRILRGEETEEIVVIEGIEPGVSEARTMQKNQL